VISSGCQYNCIAIIVGGRIGIGNTLGRSFVVVLRPKTSRYERMVTVDYSNAAGQRDSRSREPGRTYHQESKQTLTRSCNTFKRRCVHSLCMLTIEVMKTSILCHRNRTSSGSDSTYIPEYLQKFELIYILVAYHTPVSVDLNARNHNTKLFSLYCSSNGDQRNQWSISRLYRPWRRAHK
jgi:hypothetical protein